MPLQPAGSRRVARPPRRSRLLVMRSLCRRLAVLGPRDWGGPALAAGRSVAPAAPAARGCRRRCLVAAVRLGAGRSAQLGLDLVDPQRVVAGHCHYERDRAQERWARDPSGS
eukprot:7341503-Alexandrium_andersonii.AAC.1